ncbi:MAG: CD1871A family CXXC motif-containing protein [Blautia obeum]
MKSEKASQILLLTAGLVLFFGGIFRAKILVLSKAIKLCMECVGIG